jgi:hypothetical protein
MRRYLTIGGLIAGLIILFVLHFLHPVTVVANAPVIAESLRKSSPRFPAPVPEPGSAIPTIDSDVMLAMKVFVSVVLLGASMYVILSSKYVAKDKNWAYGIAGTLVGFWLKV